MYNLLVFVHVPCSHIPYVIFSSCTFAFFSATTAKLYTYSIYKFVIYYCVIFCLHILLYKCDILS